MSTETANIFIIVFAGLNVVVLILTLLVVWKYTKETEKMQQAVTTQSLAMINQTELSNKMYSAAQSQVEQMSNQTQISLKMYESAQRQTEEFIHQRRLSVLPAFAAGFSWKEGGTHLRHLVLTNIGQGIAINIQIASINVAAPTPKEDITPEEIASTTYRDIELWRAGGERNFRIVFQFIQTISPGNNTNVSYFLRPNEESDKRVPTVLSVYGQSPKLDPINLLADRDSLEVDFQDIEGNRYHQIITREGDTFVPCPVKPVDELEEQSKAEQSKKTG